MGPPILLSGLFPRAAWRIPYEGGRLTRHCRLSARPRLLFQRKEQAFFRLAFSCPESPMLARAGSVRLSLVPGMDAAVLCL